MSAVIKPIEGQSYLIRNNDEWGVIVVEPKSGLFMAYSGYGAYCHTWYSTGEDGLLKFLTRLEYSYAMGKWVGASYGTRFDHEKTVQNVKRLIIERRREEQITEGAARDAWMAIIEMDYMFEEDDFIRYIMSDHELAETICGRDLDWEIIPIGCRNDPQCVGFWNNIFIPFVASYCPDHKLKAVT